MFLKSSSQFRAGELVEVRSEKEILATLDKSGELDGLPFMPEMLEFCGQRFRVFKRAHKTCDPPNGFGGRRLLSAVHLEGIRCDGASHGGCEAKCLIFWKDAWLKKAGQGAESHASSNGARPSSVASGCAGCSRHDVETAAHDVAREVNSDEPVYKCQSTHVAQATLPLQWWDLSQYVEDYTSGNVPLTDILKVLAFFVYSQVAAAGIGIGSLLRGAYDLAQKLRGGPSYPLRTGIIPAGSKTPSVRLDLRPNELVRVKNFHEIQTTMTEQCHNRGMAFDPEMVLYTDREYKVLDRVEKIIDEKTGKIMFMKNDCIILDEVTCQACYAKYRRFCPRGIYPFWREIWLSRVGSQSKPVLKQEVGSARVGRVS